MDKKNILHITLKVKKKKKSSDVMRHLVSGFLKSMKLSGLYCCQEVLGNQWSLAAFNVGGNVDFIRQLRDVDVKPVLHFIQGFCILLIRDKCHCQPLGAEASSSSNPVQVGVRVFRHIIVKNYVDPLNVHPSSKQVCGHKDSLLEVLELLIAR